MNELQQVLLIFAIFVIVGLYLLNKTKSKKKPTSSSEKQPEARQSTSESNTFDNLSEPHLPLSENTRQRLHLEDEAQLEETVPDAQLGLSFGQEFEVHKKAESHADSEKMEKTPSDEDRRKPDEIHIESLEDVSEPEVEPLLTAATEKETVKVEKTEAKKPPEEKIFALIIMGSEDFQWPKVNQTLQGVGLTPNENGIFVKNDTMGGELIRVANLLEPGTFPLEEPINSEHKIAGLVLILALPASVFATHVMHEMILMARKISQRLNGRLYDTERHLMKESDLQSMCIAASQYDNAS